MAPVTLRATDMNETDWLAMKEAVRQSMKALEAAGLDEWESLAEGIKTIQQERDLATAKLATAEVCECVYDDSWKTSQDVVTGACVYNKKCPNCTNGVVFSDERARELLQKAKERDAAYDYGSRLLKCIWPEETHPDFEVLPDMLGLMMQLDHALAARAKEGAAE